MKRFLAYLSVLALLLSTSQGTARAAAITVSLGQSFNSIDAATTGTTTYTGTAIQLPTPCLYAGCSVKLVLSYGTAPSAVSIDLQAANEDVDGEYQQIFNSGNVAGETFYIENQRSRFVRVRQVSKTGGTTVTAAVTVGPPSVGGVAHNQRFRVALADVNAGLTLLPARPGIRYRLVDEYMIAVGGAAATCTTVDVLATQSAGSVKLVANAVAGLTQSTVLRAGAANATVLADGASFVPNDVNTAITIAKTGSACATATNFDVQLTVALEQ
jgi:hypothetical protein